MNISTNAEYSAELSTRIVNTEVYILSERVSEPISFCMRTRCSNSLAVISPVRSKCSDAMMEKLANAKLIWEKREEWGREVCESRRKPVAVEGQGYIRSDT